MTIIVNTQDVTAKPKVMAEMTDQSGAHVELVLLAGDLPPIRHAFDFTEGTVSVPLSELSKGKHKCTLIVHAFKHRHSLSRVYDVALSVNGSTAAVAKGSIPSSRTSDVGFGDFVLTIA